MKLVIGNSMTCLFSACLQGCSSSGVPRRAARVLRFRPRQGLQEDSGQAAQTSLFADEESVLSRRYFVPVTAQAEIRSIFINFISTV